MAARKQWFATSVHIFDGDLGIDLRERFGPAGLCMWVGFLAACKRSINPGKVSYSSDAECLSLMGLPGLELVNEEGEPFTLDAFWTFLGQHKQTSRTTRRRLVYVTATRWEQWQNDGKRESEAERKRRSRAKSERTEPGHDADETRTDRDSERDSDNESDSSSDSDAAAADREALFSDAVDVLVEWTMRERPAKSNPGGYAAALKRGKWEDHYERAMGLLDDSIEGLTAHDFALVLEPDLAPDRPGLRLVDRERCRTCNDTTWLNADMNDDGTWGAPKPCPDCNETRTA